MRLPDNLTTEGVLKESDDLDRLSPLELVQLMNSQDRQVVDAVAAQDTQIACLVRLAGDCLAAGGRIFYVGAGTSGRLGILDASECPPTFNADPEMVQGLIAGGNTAIQRAVEGAEDSEQQGGLDLSHRGIKEDDLVIGIAASGFTPYVLGAVRYARQLGCITGAITCNAGSPLEELAEHPVVVVVGPEILSGSTRLKAGTATKMVLNMISTGAMVRIGKTFGNLMVDLQASNQKLVERTNRLLSRLTDLDPEAAAELLESADGELKTAVLMHRLSMDAKAARDRLAITGGRLREAMQQP